MEYIGHKVDSKQILAAAFEAMGRRRDNRFRETGFIYYHGVRVARIALSLRADLGMDPDGDDILFAAGVFHDLGKGSRDHHLVGADSVRPLLKPFFEIDELDEISEIITCHNERGHPEYSDEIKIIQDADILDHYGAIGVWMQFVYSGIADENIFDCLAFWKGEIHRGLIDESRRGINYDVSRRRFERRLEVMQRFMREFESEINPE